MALVSAAAGALMLMLNAQGVAQEPEQPQSTQAEATAEQPAIARLFVSDKLVLNVYSEPAQGGERVATIETGDVVDELERADGSVRVRLSDGREGWVGANYLIDDAPAAVRLRELQREQNAPAADKKSIEEIARLRKQNATLESELKALKDNAAAAAAEAERAGSEHDESIDEFDDASSVVQHEATTESSRYETWLIALLAAAIAALIGFAAGYQMLARRVRAKFGGLKVYQ